MDKTPKDVIYKKLPSVNKHLGLTPKCCHKHLNLKNQDSSYYDFRIQSTLMSPEVLDTEGR